MSACLDTGCILDNDHEGQHRNTSGLRWGQTPPRSIPINLAIRAVKINIAKCDAEAEYFVKSSHNAVYEFRDTAREFYTAEPTSAFILAARAGYKTTLEYLLYRLEKCYSHDVKLSAESQWVDVNELFAAVRPLIEHLDATRPNWRTE